MRLRAPDGFTLLELLLAISLLSLITGSILGGLHVGRRAWETSRVSESLDEVENTLRAVSMLLARSYSVPIASQDATTGQILFDGKPDACRFIMLSEGGAQWGGLIVAEIAGEANGPTANLVVWTSVFRSVESASADRGAMNRTVILKDLTSIRLSYFGVVEQSKPPVWTDNWARRIALPQLIAIKIGANRLGRAIELSTTVATRQQ